MGQGSIFIYSLANVPSVSQGSTGTLHLEETFRYLTSPAEESIHRPGILARGFPYPVWRRESIVDLKSFRFTGGDSVIYVHTYYFYIIFHYKLLQDIDDGNLLFLVSSLTFQSTTQFGSSFLLLFGD